MKYLIKNKLEEKKYSCVKNSVAYIFYERSVNSALSQINMQETIFFSSSHDSHI